ncbi:MAG: DNA mismatch repair protein MutS [Eubacteriales bacterium]
MAELTPMMQQYFDIKEQNPDCILFFRLGDFYEMFADDARAAAEELDLTLTSRDKAKAKDDPTRIPMCGIPYHASENYIARLVAKGYKVAICEQVENPAEAKGLVKRDIVRIITPGTITESSMLEEGKNNYFASVYAVQGTWGLCFADVSTGGFFATTVGGLDCKQEVLSQIGKFAPAEILLGGELLEDGDFLRELKDQFGICISQGDEVDFAYLTTKETVETHFSATLDNLSLEGLPAVVQAAGGLLATLYRVQKSKLTHIRTLEFYHVGTFMEVDLTARRNLELTHTLRNKERRGSLLWVMDKTKTPMGSRLIRSWLEKPLLNPKLIEKRLDSVAELVGRTVERSELVLQLKEIGDLERTMTRIVGGSANGRDLVALASGCQNLATIQEALGQFQSSMLATIAGQIDTLEDMTAAINQAMVDEPPFTVREGGLIRLGYSEEVDKLRDVMNGGTDTLAAIEAAEKEKTGIKTMKVGYNRVFGYFIEVSKGAVSQVPDTYIRKQTLTNAERYITPELKDLEHTILTAKDRIATLEYQLFDQLRQWVAGQVERVQQTASAIACADVLCNLAELAVKEGYCRPHVDLTSEIFIEDGRHPVVERVLKNELFVPNNTTIGGTYGNIAIITGPNMAGKSTYMRQVALITLMAQMGSFVPAKSARIGVVDRLFTRIGASDDLAAGQSTFMVEMTEVAHILRHATSRSLLILDEVGRGTSTFDGMAIAKAVVEHIAKKVGAKTLFATHYHELTAMENEHSTVKNYNISVKKRNGTVVFLRKIVHGGADDSFGVDVAKLAGLPKTVITRAGQILKELESGQPKIVQVAPESDQMFMGNPVDDAIRQKLEQMSIDTMSPIEAMNFLYQLKQML